MKVAIRDLIAAADANGRSLIVNVVSTVLPGTMAREIEPILGERCSLSYNPFFIAMVISDYDAHISEPGCVVLLYDDMRPWYLRAWAIMRSRVGL